MPSAYCSRASRPICTTVLVAASAARGRSRRNDRNQVSRPMVSVEFDLHSQTPPIVNICREINRFTRNFPSNPWIKRYASTRGVDGYITGAGLRNSPGRIDPKIPPGPSLIRLQKEFPLGSAVHDFQNGFTLSSIVQDFQLQHPGRSRARAGCASSVERPAEPQNEERQRWALSVGTYRAQRFLF